MTDQYDCIVIGSGMGGMTAARLLTEYGKKKVLVLERHFKAGGMTHTFIRKARYSFGTGLHYVGFIPSKISMTGKIMHYLADWSVDWLPLPHEFDTYLHSDIRFPISASQQETMQALQAKFPDEAVAIAQYYKNLPRFVRGFFLYHISHLVPYLIRFGMRKYADIFSSRSTMTLQDYLDEMFVSPALKGILACQWPNMGSPPGKMANAYYALMQQHFSHGAFYPSGGPGAFSKAIINGITSRGGTILTNHDVQEIVVDKNRAVGVVVYDNDRRKEKYFEAKNIISDAGFRNTYGLLTTPEHTKHSIGQDKLKKFNTPDTSMRACILFISLKESPESLGFTGGNYWMVASHDHTEAFSYPTGEGGCYLSCPSLKDQKTKNHTMEIVTHARYEDFTQWKDTEWPRKEQSYCDYKEQISQRIIERVEKFFPGFKDLILCYELGTPLTFGTFQNAVEGSFYGLPVTPERLKDSDASVKTPIKGLFLTGQDTVSPGIAPAMIGGVEATLEILGKATFFKLMRNLNRQEKRNRQKNISA